LEIEYRLGVGKGMERDQCKEGDNSVREHYIFKTEIKNGLGNREEKRKRLNN
jgi:hypothetical protein